MLKLNEITLEYIKSLDQIEKEIPREIKIPETNDIKALLGPRRVGKTFLLLKEARNRLKQNNQIIYISFDEPYFRKIDVKEFAKLVRKEYPEGKVFLFLDEIQDWENWDFNLRWLFEMKDFNLYVSGSSSSLLSSEIPTRLRGRYISVQILPLSFREICSPKNIEFREKGRILNLFDQYMMYGGFPEVWMLRSREKIISILETIFYRDILERFNIREKRVFKDFFDFVIRNYSSKVSYNSLSKLLKTENISLDPKTVSTYLKYMEDSFLIFLVEPYEFSYKRALKLPKKLYLIDTCFCSLYDFSLNLGRKLENIVFVDLLRKFGRENIFYNYNPEIDFVVKEQYSNKIILGIQVCFELNSKNKKREVENLLNFDCEQKYIITYDQFEEIGEIKVVPFWYFSMNSLDILNIKSMDS